MDDFEKVEDTSAENGKLDEDADSIEDCKTVCLAQDTCTGFDYDSSSEDRCWLHTSDLSKVEVILKQEMFILKNEIIYSVYQYEKVIVTS